MTIVDRAQEWIIYEFVHGLETHGGRFLIVLASVALCIMFVVLFAWANFSGSKR